MPGPLQGVNVVELAGLGPAPFAAMLLADMGADVITVARTDRAFGMPMDSAKGNVQDRGKRSIAVDLKQHEGVEILERLCERADVFIEGFRPGVAERLGIGPDVLRLTNPRLVYARMTGWGQDGPFATRAGHDINYLALAGPLAHIGRVGQPPTPPLNLVGDFGGGGLLAAFGIVCALAERERSGEGQVIDAAMVDGAALLSAPIATAYEQGYFHPERGTNWLDSGAHYYEAYECADGEFLSIGAIEPAFYANLLAVLGLNDEDLPDQNDESAWPTMKDRIAAVLRTRSRDDWMAAFGDDDQCVAPVLGYAEVAQHPHLCARRTYVEREGVLQPSPAPRFDRTPASLGRAPAPVGFDTDEILTELGISAADRSRLRNEGTVG